MEKFVKEDIVVVPFPFSDLSGTKRRPALVLADVKGNDIILCQITGKMTKDTYAIPLNKNSFISGGLPLYSFVRPSRIFTADKNSIIRKAGSVKEPIITKVIRTIFSILNS